MTIFGAVLRTRNSTSIARPLMVSGFLSVKARWRMERYLRSSSISGVSRMTFPPARELSDRRSKPRPLSYV